MKEEKDKIVYYICRGAQSFFNVGSKKKKTSGEMQCKQTYK